MIAIIPARKGSKGVVNKNTKLFLGKPLIAHTIEAAQKSKYISEILVTTDCLEVQKICTQYGLNIPFLRPDCLSQDNSLARDVYIHALNFLENRDGLLPKEFIVLQPTSPLRNCKHIDEAIEKFTLDQNQALVSVKEAKIPMAWYKKIDRNTGLLKNAVNTKLKLLNRQDYDIDYIPNGAIYIFDSKCYLKETDYYELNITPYIMPEAHSIDIDTVEDFIIGEMFMGMDQKV